MTAMYLVSCILEILPLFIGTPLDLRLRVMYINIILLCSDGISLMLISLCLNFRQAEYQYKQHVVFSE